MNIHLLHDGKFLSHAINQFERYSPGNNTFIFFGQLPAEVEENESLLIKVDRNFSSNDSLEVISSILNDRSNKHKLFLHYLSLDKCNAAINISNRFEVELYWIFYGGDLYNILEKENIYKLNDESHDYFWRKVENLKNEVGNIIRYGSTRKKIMANAILAIDYFCFWNEYDFELVEKHFRSNLSYLFFIYSELISKKVQFWPKAQEIKILVNHSGSNSGNHQAILSRLGEMNVNGDFEVVCPLSYGDPNNIKGVVETGGNIFGDQFVAQTDFIPIDDYYKMLNTVPIAIFGHRRQEAAGNIFYLLAVGAKVFLREENSMMKWLIKRGFIVFSYEKDLNSFEDIIALRQEDALVNLKIYNDVFSDSQERDYMRRLLK